MRPVRGADGPAYATVVPIDHREVAYLLAPPLTGFKWGTREAGLGTRQTDRLNWGCLSADMGSKAQLYLRQ